MSWEIIEDKLTDGSIVYAVTDECQTVFLDAVDHAAALRIVACLSRDCVDVRQ